LQEFLLRNGVSAEDATQMRLAFVEAANNSIQYAAAGSETPAATAELNGETLTITVIDHNGPFAFAPATEPPSPEEEHGRGLFLISAIMDRVEYRRDPQTNFLRMVKRLKIT